MGVVRRRQARRPLGDSPARPWDDRAAGSAPEPALCKATGL